MINVVIAGSNSAIKRHTNALSKMQDIRINGCWSTHGSHDTAVDLNTGISCANPDIILEKADALIITDPGKFNNQLATFALRKARHVFLYPSVLHSTSEVYQLIKLAREANVILKCGRTGNFCINALSLKVSDLNAISIIEFQHNIKISPANPSPVIADILLADIEIINSFIKARNTSIKVKGLSLISSQPEFINARLEFDNGSVVNYSCNIVGTQNEHLITFVLKDSVLRYSIVNNELSGWYLKPTINQNENPIFIENIQVEQTDYLYDDLCGFLDLIHSGPAFLSIYDNGFESFVLTDRILEKVSKTLVPLA